MVLEIKNQNGGKKIKLEDLLSKNLDSTGGKYGISVFSKVLTCRFIYFFNLD